MMQSLTSVLDRLETEQSFLVSITEPSTSLEFLQKVYRNSALGLPVRMRAAIAALPFELPKLAVTAVVTEHDFATLLEARIQNMERLNGNGRVLEARPEIEARPVRPHTNDKRFRRL